MSMKALVLTTATKSVSVKDVPKPVPGPGEVLVRVHAVALNMVDSVFVSMPIAEQAERVVGLDFAGVVETAADDLSSSSDSRVKTGARVAGFLQGACSNNERPGAFAEYVTVPYDLVWQVPASLSFEQASAVSMCGLTAAQAVFSRLGMPSPFSKTEGFPSSPDPINVLVYGASTSLGMYIAQLVRVAGETSGRKIRLIGAASAGKHALLKAAPYNYDVLVDYRKPGWKDEVLKATGGAGVQYAADTISEGETVANVDSVLASDGRYAVFLGPAVGGYDAAKLRHQPMYGAAWEALGVEVNFGGNIIPASSDARSFGADFYKWLSSGGVKLQPNPIRSMPGGLERIGPDGFAVLGGLITARQQVQRTEDYMKPVSGEKLVYSIA